MSEPAPPPHTRALRWHGLTVRVSCTAAADLAWLEQFLVPWLELREGPADCHVELTADDAEYRSRLTEVERERRAPAHCFSLDRGALRLPSWTAGDGKQVVLDERLRCLYVVERYPPRVRVVTAGGNLAARFAAMRVVRELAMERARADGHLLLHAACFAVGDRALLIAAPKNGGKTSLLLAGLLRGGARYVSNDRVVLRFGAAGVAADGMPTLVSIRRPTLELNPALRRCFEAARTTHWLAARGEEVDRNPPNWNAASVDLTPSQVCALLGVEAQASGRAGALLFPRLGGAAGGSGAAELSAAQAAHRVEQSVFGAEGERDPSIFASLLGGKGGADRTSEAAAELVRRVPCFELPLSEGGGACGPALDEILDRCAAPHLGRLGAEPA